MHRKNYLKNKRILIFDDEPDILDTVQELLSMCKVFKTTNFDGAANFLETEKIDITILDIMGVNGYELLAMAHQKNVIAVILTTHSIRFNDRVKSLQKGTTLFIPKEKMIEIETCLNNVLEARKKGENLWWRWMDRFDAYYEDRFEPDWKNRGRHLRENFPYFSF